MRPLHGDHVMVSASTKSCPAAARAFGFGCYGCRDATDIGHNETVIGFPASFFPAIVEHLEHLNKKALPQSRGKHALAALKKQLKGVKEEGSCASL